MKMTLRYLGIAILILSVVLSGCNPKTTPTSTPVATEPPVIDSGETISGFPQTVSRTIQLDPATTGDADGLALNSLLYEGLVTLDATNTPQPALAVSWTVSEDQLDYVITLRQDVTFHSGTPFNADAVLVNFTRWFDPQDPLHGSKTYAGWSEFFSGFKGDIDANGVAISPFDGIEKVDNLNVLIHLNRPFPDLLFYLTQPYFAMVDPSVLAANVDTFGTSAETSSGTGAYSVLSWDDTGLVLTPNANYWDVIPAGEVQIGWK